MILQILQVVAIVFFVIVGILLAAIVLIQDEQGDSIGGLFSGGSNSAFGSRSGNILTKTTTVLGALFIGLAILLAFWYRTPRGDVVPEAQISTESTSDWLTAPLPVESPLDDPVSPSSREPVEGQ